MCRLLALRQVATTPNPTTSQQRQPALSFDDRLDDWKPSVYWVMLCLFLATAVLSASASALYSQVEQWSYVESLYFCFVAFSTIGFGDLVPNQRAVYPNLLGTRGRSEPNNDTGSDDQGDTALLYFQVITWYRAANFLILSAGCCCIYSLFNVTSIVIKQCLNWLIRRLDCSCKRNAKPGQKPARSRRNALTPAQLRAQAKVAARTGTSSRKSGRATDAVSSDSDIDSTYDSGDERGHTGELICMSEMLRANKVSLAVMQKQLYETAQRGVPVLLPPRSLQEQDTFKPGAVGPLAIVSEKFGDSRG